MILDIKVKSETIWRRLLMQSCRARALLRLNKAEQQPAEHDGDDHEQFDQCETITSVGVSSYRGAAVPRFSTVISAIAKTQSNPAKSLSFHFVPLPMNRHPGAQAYVFNRGRACCAMGFPTTSGDVGARIHRPNCCARAARARASTPKGP